MPTGREEVSLYQKVNIAYFVALAVAILACFIHWTTGTIIWMTALMACQATAGVRLGMRMAARHYDGKPEDVKYR